MLREVTESTFDEGVIEGSIRKPVLVEMYTPWCGPCKMMKPVLERIQIENEDINVYLMDISEEYEIAKTYAVKGTPTLLLFSDGQVVWEHTGALPKQDLSAKLSELVSV